MKRVLEVGVSRTDFLSNAAIGGELLADRLASEPLAPAFEETADELPEERRRFDYESCLVRGICG